MGSIVKVGYSQIVTPNSADADPTVDSTMVSGLVSGGPVSLFYGFIGKLKTLRLWPILTLLHSRFHRLCIDSGIVGRNDLNVSSIL
jgi:hypothetical protein